MTPGDETGSKDQGLFPPTQWTLVLNAESDPDALALICKTYWFPLFTCARQLRSNPDDAKDLTQSFFHHLLSSNALASVRAERGKLRSFLLTALKNHAREDHRHQSRLKRGGHFFHLPLDDLTDDQRQALEPREKLTPDRAFDQAWATQLLNETLQLLETSYQVAGKLDLFRSLRPQLVTHSEQRPYAEIADELGLTESAVRLAAFRLRTKYRDALKEAVSRTVASPDQISDELAHLRTVFSA